MATTCFLENLKYTKCRSKSTKVEETKSCSEGGIKGRSSSLETPCFLSSPMVHEDHQIRKFTIRTAPFRAGRPIKSNTARPEHARCYGNASWQVWLTSLITNRFKPDPRQVVSFYTLTSHHLITPIGSCNNAPCSISQYRPLPNLKWLQAKFQWIWSSLTLLLPLISHTTSGAVHQRSRTPVTLRYKSRLLYCTIIWQRPCIYSLEFSQ